MKKKSGKNIVSARNARPRGPRVPVPRVIGEPAFFSEFPKRSKITEFADRRQNNPTPAEDQLRRILNGLNGGVLRGQFKREHVISGKWIVDFFFPEIRLAIEVDGPVHRTQDQSKRDRQKDADCARFDITVLRITNREIYVDREALIEKLRAGWKEAINRENRIIGKDLDRLHP